MIRLTQFTTAANADFQIKANEAFLSLLARNDLGFFKVISRHELWESSMSRAHQVRMTADHLVVCGIGGSSLGGQALLRACAPQALNKNVTFLQNIDAYEFWKFLDSLKNLDLRRIHWALVSKSGNTIETLAIANYVCQFLEECGVDLVTNCTVISENKKNPLTIWAQTNAIFQLEIPQDVGGRFSVLTPVGLFPAAFTDLSLDELKLGAQWALSQTQLVSDLVAQTLASFDRQEWLTFFWFYCDRLKDFSGWVQQLWSESLGKSVDRAGGSPIRTSIPIPCLGTIDQHSVLQQIAEGFQKKFNWFVRVQEAEKFGPELKRSLFPAQDFLVGKNLGVLLAAEAQATQLALNHGDMNTVTLTLDQIGPKEMGALFMLFELVVGSIGEALNINAFDQPGVELGKKLALSMLLEAADNK